MVSRLINQALEGGHSLKAWGERLGTPKSSLEDYSKLSFEMIEYCIQDTLVTLVLYKYLLKYIDNPIWAESIDTEHKISYVCSNELHKNGFFINQKNINRLLKVVNHRLNSLSFTLQETFKPLSKIIREITPRRTKKGTLNLKDFRWIQGDIIDKGLNVS